MATPVGLTSVVRSQSAGSTLTGLSVTVATTGSAVVVYASCYRASTTGELLNAPTASGVTFEVITDGTTSAKSLKATDSGGGSGRIGHYWFIARNVAAGALAITLNMVNASATCVAAFACEVPRVPTSGSYCARAVNATAAAGVTSVSVAFSQDLSQARNTVLAVASGIGTDAWNGSTSGDGVQPSGWNMLRGYCPNFTGGSIDGPPFQAAYLDTTTVVRPSASWSVVNNTFSEGFVATAVALLDTETSLYVEILLQPQSGIAVNGSSGWTVEVSAGSPSLGATIHTNITAQATGNELRVPAPVGVTAGQQVNVIAYNGTLAHATGTSVGTTRGLGTVKA